jgi:predicted HAD superfamily phosphohydrolase YqeG
MIDNKKTLILDLDETLVHCSLDRKAKGFPIRVENQDG